MGINEVAKFMSEDMRFIGLAVLIVAVNVMGYYYIYYVRSDNVKKGKATGNSSNRDIISKLHNAISLLKESDKNLPEAEQIYENLKANVPNIENTSSTNVKRLVIELERRIESAYNRMEVSKNREKIAEKFFMEQD